MRLVAPTLLLTGVLAAPAAAQLSAGVQAPEIKVRSWYHRPPGTSLAELRGRVVYLEFWATW